MASAVALPNPQTFDCKLPVSRRVREMQFCETGNYLGKDGLFKLALKLLIVPELIHAMLFELGTKDTPPRCDHPVEFPLWFAFQQ